MFRKRTPYIEFHADPTLLDVLKHPVPANKAMPDWFKKLKPQVEGTDKSDAGTVKRCMPVMDAVSQGFIIPLWADLKIKVDKDEESPGDLKVWVSFPEIDLFQGGNLLETHAWDQVGNACDLKKFALGKVLMKFVNPWVIETPKGYSVQLKNPSNNWSTNISLIEGVVDTDEYYNPINLPFVWTGDEIGEFIIPAGTPLVHVIPFKRQTYKMKVRRLDPNRLTLVGNKLKTKFIDRYKTLFWHKRKK